MSFLVGGALCAVCQVLIDKFPLTPARLLVGLFMIGATLSALGLYDPILEFAKSGLSVPLPGFGHVMMQGVMKEIRAEGAIGILTGGLKSASAGITVSVVCAFVAALFARSKQPK